MHDSEHFSKVRLSEGVASETLQVQRTGPAVACTTGSDGAAGGSFESEKVQMRIQTDELAARLS
jgi:hypothetical protein